MKSQERLKHPSASAAVASIPGGVVIATPDGDSVILTPQAALEVAKAIYQAAQIAEATSVMLVKRQSLLS